MEVDSWAALLKAPRAVLAGDHLQLPPTIISKEAEKKVQSIPDMQLLGNPLFAMGFRVSAVDNPRQAELQ